jgi:hypothetical protein
MENSLVGGLGGVELESGALVMFGLPQLTKDSANKKPVINLNIFSPHIAFK